MYWTNIIDRNMSFITTNWEGRKITHCQNVSEKDKRCIIVIPIYKENPNAIERASLKQCVNILGQKYELLLVCPDALDLSKYKEESNYDFSVLFCDKSYFKTQKSYSDLCETWQLYELLIDYEYMIIYQLDAWVFEDKLEYFMNMGYDYFGAIHLIGYQGNYEGRVGNGGFSLRNTKKFRDVCKKTDFTRFPLLEDRVFCETLKNNFKLPPLNICREFSFQDEPDLCYRKNGNKLPMGCHKFDYSDWRKGFWKKYIKINGLPETTNIPTANKIEFVRNMGYNVSNTTNKKITTHRIIRKFR